MFFQICFSSHKLFPFILQFPFQSIRIERMDIYTNFYAIWRSVSLEIEKIIQLLILTVLVLSFLKHWPLRLTFSIFLASPFMANYSNYHFLHLPGKDLSKLVGKRNTKHCSMWHDDSKTDCTLKIFWQPEAAKSLVGFSAAWWNTSYIIGWPN